MCTPYTTKQKKPHPKKGGVNFVCTIRFKVLITQIVM